MKLVKVDDICNLCMFYFHGECTIEDIEDCECLVRSMEIIDAEPVKHGKPYPHIIQYIGNGGKVVAEYQEGWECPFCGEVGVKNYCPDCGAKMDGGN